VSLSGLSNEQRLKLGIFWDQQPQTIIISVRNGSYKLITDKNTEMAMAPNDMVQLSVEGNKIRLKNLNTNFGLFSQVQIIEQTDSSSLNIKSKVPKMANRVYEDDFYITPSAKKLRIINHANLSNYVAGVVQWESGNGNTDEYYKAQAIITRTYALKNINKYKSQGFNLCDRVDSQVYKGRTTNKLILAAVAATKNLVIVDENMNLISALFHSNSGGRTQNSENVWTQKMPYLRAVEDTFSLDMPHYYWEKTYTQQEWLTTFKKNWNVDIKHRKTKIALLNYCPTITPKYILPKQKVKLTEVRSKFKMRSTNFCVKTKGGTVTVTGRGFGHGVGLSQEGAMKMTLQGYSYEEVLAHYYQGIHIVQLNTMDLLETIE
jgi:stage II sporulation protein D